MHAFDFLSQDDLDEAPEEPRAAFVHLVSAAQRKLDARINGIPDDDQEGFRLIEEARHGFMNVVLALSKSYKIEPFASQELPTYDRFDVGVHRRFRSDLDHYLTQLLVDNSLRGKRDSTFIPPNVKDRLRAYIYGLREAIDNADLSDAKRAALHEKLTEFEAELEKQRLSLLAVTRLMIAIATIPGGLWASYEVVSKLSQNVLQAVGEAKAVEDESRKLPPKPAPAQLMPPRETEPESPPLRSSFSQDLDDEIPF